MTNRNTSRVFTWALTAGSFWLVIYLLKDCKGFMAPAPAGIHGTYSSTSYNPTYKAPDSKDSLLILLEDGKMLVRSGRLNSYDPPWDSLRYLIGNIQCDTGRIEAYIEFLDKKEPQSTFRVLWFNATPTTDDKIYDRLTNTYYQCFERELSSFQVRKVSDALNGNR
jgi:hypothetical protein